MAKQTMIDTTALVGGTGEAYDVSGSANSVLFEQSATELVTTSLSDTVVRRIGGLKDAKFSMSVMDEGATDPWTTLTDLIAADPAHFAWIESNASMAEQDRGCFLKALETTVSRGGDVGGLHVMQVAGVGDGELIYGQVAQQDESLTVTGTSTGWQWGALAAGETMYVTCFVLSATAGTIDVTIESDDNGSFTSATTRATFTQFSAVSAEQQTVAGAVTDDYWRVAYTIATGPFTIVVLWGKGL